MKRLKVTRTSRVGFFSGCLGSLGLRFSKGFLASSWGFVSGFYKEIRVTKCNINNREQWVVYAMKNIIRLSSQLQGWIIPEGTQPGLQILCRSVYQVFSHNFGGIQSKELVCLSLGRAVKITQIIKSSRFLFSMKCK